MGTLYDERYQGSGAMLEQLAAGSLVACIWGSYSGVLLALGKVAAMTTLTAIQIVCQFGMMFIGYHYGGNAGLVIGVAAANWIVHPAHAFVMSLNGLWQPKVDLILLAVSALIMVLAWPRSNLILCLSDYIYIWTAHGINAGIAAATVIYCYGEFPHAGVRY